MGGEGGGSWRELEPLRFPFPPIAPTVVLLGHRVIGCVAQKRSKLQFVAPVAPSRNTANECKKSAQGIAPPSHHIKLG